MRDFARVLLLRDIDADTGSLDELAGIVIEPAAVTPTPSRIWLPRFPNQTS